MTGLVLELTSDPFGRKLRSKRIEVRAGWPFPEIHREEPVKLDGAWVVRLRTCPDCFRRRIGIAYDDREPLVIHDDGSIAVDDERLHALVS